MSESVPEGKGSPIFVCPKCGRESLHVGECFACAAPDATASFPELDPLALHGLPGAFVNLMGPVSEVHPAALLFEFLVTFGCCVGGGPTLELSGNRQPGRLFMALVGESSHARKSSSRNRVRPVFEAAATSFGKRCFGAPSSAEGLLELVRDVESDDQGNPKHGTNDKRALLHMPELAKLLRTMERSGQTMSPVLREAFDIGTLRVIRRVDPLTSTEPHICIVGNITGPELFGLMHSVDVWNGFANRFCYVMTDTVRELPFGGIPDPIEVNGVARRLSKALEAARKVNRVVWGTARAQWPEVYHELRRKEAGPIGAILARRDTLAIRLAVLYALCDGSGAIEEEHLVAACAAWAYCETSARYMWDAWGAGSATVEGVHRAQVNYTAERITRILHATRSGDFLSRSDLFALFSRNVKMALLEKLMEQLVASGDYAEETMASQGGRPATGWRRV